MTDIQGQATVNRNVTELFDVAVYSLRTPRSLAVLFNSFLKTVNGVSCFIY